MTYSSPNRMVRQCYSGTRNAAIRARNGNHQDDKKQDIQVCILLSVATVETFLNVLFRVIVSESGYTQHADRLLKDLRYPFLSLDGKLKNWPKDILGNSLNLETGIGREFMELKSKRNSLMHFSSSHETHELPGNVTIDGLANTQVFDSLTVEDAVTSIGIVERFIEEIFRLKGILPEQIPGHLHLWTGKVP